MSSRNVGGEKAHEGRRGNYDVDRDKGNKNLLGLVGINMFL